MQMFGEDVDMRKMHHLHARSSLLTLSLALATPQPYLRFDNILLVRHSIICFITRFQLERLHSFPSPCRYGRDAKWQTCHVHM
jgi:hypothetical protein